MSTGETELSRTTDHRGLKLSSIGFVLLLALALVWPAPVLWINEMTVDAPLAIDERAFLGREAPQWDVVFWAIAGIYVLMLFHAKTREVGMAWGEFVRDCRSFPKSVRAKWNGLRKGRAALLGAISIAVVAAIWIFLDAPLIGIAEKAHSEGVRDVIRIFNRLGGGMNPLMIIVFFALAGMLFAHPRWSQMAIAMAAAAAGAGIMVQILKVIVGRTRPELWLGPFHHVFPSASSFPSGHTVGAFAIAGVILFSAAHAGLRLFALAVASAIALSRVLTFRHWFSDVVAAAILGLAFGWFFATAVLQRDDREATASDAR
ncbi:MAG TPA: phosphatase PAP2 family protein [Thermoanaerobaculia bacterium]|nr:phosphatase PAP2 family protein [Thermoanaerobaculia bacterium]